MNNLKEKSDEQYKSQFSRYIKEGVDSKGVEALYKKVHAAIRADPKAQKKDKKAPAQQKRWNRKKESLTQRKLKVAAKKEKLLKKINA